MLRVFVGEGGGGACVCGKPPHTQQTADVCFVSPPPPLWQMAWPAEAFVLGDDGLPVMLQLPLLEHLAAEGVQ